MEAVAIAEGLFTKGEENESYQRHRRSESRQSA